MQSYYDLIILSPHLDDAALSCGGNVYQHTAVGQRVLVVTVMAGEPQRVALSTFAQALHERWQLAGVETTTRRREDETAMAILGADFLHWPVPDCIYRHHPQSEEPLYASNEELFGDLHPVEGPLVAVIADRLRTLPAYGELLAPLAVGNHVDHQLTQRAAQAVTTSLRYYEEYPYAVMPGAVDRALGENRRDWQAEVIPLSPPALQTKIEAIAAYQSQVSTFFADGQDMARQVRQYAQQVGGERLWSRLA